MGTGFCNLGTQHLPAVDGLVSPNLVEGIQAEIVP